MGHVSLIRSPTNDKAANQNLENQIPDTKQS